MAVTATVADRPIIHGDSAEVLVKLPDGTAGRYTLSLFDIDPEATLTALVRASTKIPAQAKTRIGLIVPGLVLDLTDPVVVVTVPSDDDVAVAAFQAALMAWLILRAKRLFALVDDGSVQAGADTAMKLYQAASTPAQARCDQVMSLVRP